MLVHALFDLLAWLVGAAIAWRLRPKLLALAPAPRAAGPLYLVAVSLGAGCGALALGTLNLELAGRPEIGRSILGALIGGILGAELYKARAGIAGSTGGLFVLPLAVGIAIGRVGCFLAGLDDYTYGTPTGLPWAHDFGDGVGRHPVQLYESLAMLCFALWFWARLRTAPQAAARYGFYWFAGFYALQRIAWEWLKPYPALLGPFDLFQIACLGLLLYAAAMLSSLPALARR
jgi:prolipoprotein diacylglyceryltransferase